MPSIFISRRCRFFAKFLIYCSLFSRRIRTGTTILITKCTRSTQSLRCAWRWIELKAAKVIQTLNCVTHELLHRRPRSAKWCSISLERCEWCKKKLSWIRRICVQQHFKQIVCTLLMFCCDYAMNVFWLSAVHLEYIPLNRFDDECILHSCGMAWYSIQAKF